MDSTSKFVINGRDGAKSALIKAFESWTTPYDIRPDGVFGSVATITSGQVTLSSDALDIEFQIPFDDDMEPDEAEIKVYNLSDNTLRQLKKGAAISVTAGYTGDTGLIFSGFITRIKTVHDGADKVTSINAMDDIKDHTIESIEFSKGTKASYILKKLIDKTGIPVAAFSPRRDYTYKDSQTVDGDQMENISRYAKVCGISVYVSRGRIYARYIKDGDNTGFTVSGDTGLIGAPSPFEEEVTAEDFTETVSGYEVEMLMQHRMCAGAIVALKSADAFGTYRVTKGEHRFSAYECITKFKMY